MLRFKILSSIFLLGFFAVVARMFYWQIVRGEDLARSASAQYESKKLVSAPRGSILASDKSWFAVRTTSYLVYASLPDLKDTPKKLAETLAPFFVEDPEDRQALLNEIDRIYHILSRREVVWVPVKRQISNDTKKNIESLKLSGIGFEKEEARIYPEASAAAHLLGFVGKNEEGEDVGYFGLEGFYNLPLSGKPGFVLRENDARGVPIVFGNTQDVAAISGIDLITHIDKSIQLSVERRLKEGIERYGAKAGTAIVMRPDDGAILAMASFPSFDPASYSRYGNEFFKNPAISDAFEPGSVFKVVVMAAGLDAGVIEPDTQCGNCDGPARVDKYEIGTWNKQYHPNTTMTEVIVNSDNVGMVFVGEKLGKEKLYDYIDKFGFGRVTSIDLQGEASPALRQKSTWNIVDQATATFGQGIAVTPIQMITAVAAIANGGFLPTPQVVDKLSKDGWVEDIRPQIGQRIISENAATQITAMMQEAASRGESKWTNLQGFSVAGKTGTAQIPIAGHYDAEKTIASFVGFAPASKPKFVMLVTLRETQTSPWASETAAPLWYSIARDIFPYLGIHPEN